VHVRLAWQNPVFESEGETIRRLAKVADLSFGEPTDEPGAHDVLSDGNGIFVPLGDAIDIARECARLGTEIERLGKLITTQHRKLANTQFVDRAPALVVDNERRKLSAWEEQSTVLAEKRRLLGCA
jgi:valyl-tRNA synthetase